MTAPIQPSASTAPVRDRAYWTNVLHNAAKVPVEHPQYNDARAVIGMALDQMQTAADSAYDKNIRDISPGPIGTAAVSFGHGASLGLAGDQTYLKLARAAHPKTAFLSDVAGTATLGAALSPLVAGLTPVTQGVVLGGGLSAARGAIEPIAGLSRAESAALMGVGGAVTGAVLGKFVAKLGPVIGTIVKNAKALAGFGVAPADVAGITESAIRSQLEKLKVAPDIIERAVQSWKATGKLTVRGMTPLEPPAPPIQRPGETIEQIAPFAVSGPRAMPPVPTQPTLLEMQGFGTGKTVPYYPRGGAGEQAIPPGPATASPMPAPQGNLAQKQTAILAEFLQGATPQDLPQRLVTLRALGISLPPNAEQELMTYLLGPR